MLESASLVQLTPSFFRSLLVVLVQLVILAVISYFWQGYSQNLWWSAAYMRSLIFPTVLIPLLVSVAWTPKIIAYSDLDFSIQYYFRKRREVPWQDLEYWGDGEGGVFGVKFAGSGVFGIYLYTLPRDQRVEFVAFLKSRFPDKKLRGWSFRKPERQRRPREKPNWIRVAVLVALIVAALVVGIRLTGGIPDASDAGRDPTATAPQP